MLYKKMMLVATYHLEKLCISLVIKEVQIKTMRYHLLSTRMAKIKNMSNCWQRGGVTRTLMHC